MLPYLSLAQASSGGTEEAAPTENAPSFGKLPASQTKMGIFVLNAPSWLLPSTETLAPQAPRSSKLNYTPQKLYLLFCAW